MFTNLLNIREFKEAYYCSLYIHNQLVSVSVSEKIINFALPFGKVAIRVIGKNIN